CERAFEDRYTACTLRAVAECRATVRWVRRCVKTYRDGDAECRAAWTERWAARELPPAQTAQVLTTAKNTFADSPYRGRPGKLLELASVKTSRQQPVLARRSIDAQGGNHGPSLGSPCLILRVTDAPANKCGCRLARLLA